jgi:hypothetical protein
MFNNPNALTYNPNPHFVSSPGGNMNNTMLGGGNALNNMNNTGLIGSSMPISPAFKSNM